MISHPNKYGKPQQDLSNIQLTSESHDLIDRVIKKIFLHYTLISQLLKSFMLLSNESCGAFSFGGGNQRKNALKNGKMEINVFLAHWTLWLTSYTWRVTQTSAKKSVTPINSRDLDKVPTCYVCALLKCQSMCVHYWSVTVCMCVHYWIFSLMSVDTEICEQCFSWLSQYTQMTRRMSRNTSISLCSISVICITQKL